MTWRMEFHHERRRILARYEIDAALPAEAVRLGWKAVLAAYPPAARRRRATLFERAQRVEGQHPSGWLLYRIANDRIANDSARAVAVASPHAA